jgi:hypothetical protein
MSSLLTISPAVDLRPCVHMGGFLGSSPSIPPKGALHADSTRLNRKKSS